MSWLEQVEELTHSDRQRDYGPPLINCLHIAVRWSTYLNRTISPLDVALMMIDVKLARQQQTYKEDNFLDIMGYTVCIEDMDKHMKALGYERGIRAFESMGELGVYDLLMRLESMPQKAMANEDNTH